MSVTAGLLLSASTADLAPSTSLCLLFVSSRKTFLKIDVLPDGDQAGAVWPCHLPNGFYWGLLRSWEFAVRLC